MIKIYNEKSYDVDKILGRENGGVSDDILRSVKEILEDVRLNKDKALFAYTEKFDKVKLESLEVSSEEIEKAFAEVDEDFKKTLEIAKENIETYHKNQVKKGYEIKKEGGVVLGQKVIPLNRVGIYVPGGTAAYPSTVLMNAIPAKIAGVKEIVMVTPPLKDGSITKEILVAAKIAGVDKIYKVGGAQAIGALAYGTESIKRVDKITGPGNVFVATAKREVFGLCDIDMIAGPSEILVIADDKASPVCLAGDLLSQAEHDRLAQAVLITTSLPLANEVAKEIEVQLKKLPREEIARVSIENNSKIFIVDSIEKGIELSNEIAPEHLEMCVENPFDYLPLILNAGSIFLGYNTPEALGDYLAGTNHTLPTSGTARFASPLSVDDYVKKSSYIYYTKEELQKVQRRIEDFANREGLFAHANSVTNRFKK